MTPDNLKLFFFDLGGVLVHIKSDEALAKFSKALGLSTTEAAKLWRSLDALHLQYEAGTMTTKQWLNHMTEKLGIEAEQIITIFSQMFAFNDRVFDIAEKLAEKFNVSIISNTNPIHFYRIMCDYPELHLFSDPITSFYAKSLKPSSEIYLYACRRHGRQPTECAFVDDRLENVQAANDLGMTGIHYISHSQLISDLQNLGITT